MNAPFLEINKLPSQKTDVYYKNNSNNIFHNICISYITYLYIYSLYKRMYEDQ